MRWREVTLQEVDLILLVDSGPGLCGSRTLISVPEYGVEEEEESRRRGERPPGMYLRPTMAEYFMLLSVYYDNYCELDCFFGPLKPGESPWGVPPVVEDWPPYGTPEMISRVVTCPKLWELAISLPVLEAELLVETR
ncbi:unnamed protein product, partial [Choristocarpus tenellus]